eukprot:m.224292 g.224292  ORF g.224292 m.224292 type:complete len:816 (+) comp15950_c0_seq2:367-2814(+)
MRQQGKALVPALAGDPSTQVVALQQQRIQYQLTPLDATWTLSPANRSITTRENAASYPKDKELHKIYQCLLAALATEQPENPRAYLLQKIKELQGTGLSHWAQLIPEHLRPDLTGRPYWLVPEDPWDEDKPSPEMFIKAYTYNNRRLQKLGIKHWLEFVNCMKQERVHMLRNIVIANQHRKLKVYSAVIKLWRQWATDSIERRQQAYDVLRDRTRLRRLKPALMAWKSFVADEKATRALFEQLSEKAKADREAGPTDVDRFTRVLSLELRIYIFSFLGIKELCRCAQVSRAWRDVSETPELWEFTDFSPVATRVNDDAVSHVVDRHGSVMTHIKLLACQRMSNVGCREVARCSNLQDLNLSNCRRIRDDGVKHILMNCKSLIFLNLAGSKITDLTLRYLAVYAVELSYLSIAGCSDVTDAGAVAMHEGTNCKKLQWLDLSHCRNLSTQGLQHLFSACGRNLVSLMINELPAVRAGVLETIGNTCLQLQHVSMLGCKNVTDKAIRCLAGCEKLMRLQLSKNDKINGIGIRGLIRTSKSLTHVTLTRCSMLAAEALSCLATCNIVYLDVSHCPSLPDAGIRAFVEGPGPSRFLQSLHLSHCTSLTESGFMQIGLRLKCLTHLYLRYCEGVTDNCFDSMTSLNRLELLDVTGCVAITDDALLSLGSVLRPTLRSVYLAECSNISDVGIAGLVRHCNGLVSLDLHGCVLVTEEAIIQLVLKNKFLSRLNLQFCAAVTDKAVHCIASSCSSLARLNLFGLPLLTSVILDKSLRASQSLTTLALSSGLGIPLEYVNRFKRVQRGCKVHFDHLPPPTTMRFT